MKKPRTGRLALIGVLSIAAVATAAVAAGVWPVGRVVYSGDAGPLRGATSRTREKVVVDVNQPRTWAMVTLDDPNDHHAVIEAFRTDPPLGGAFRLLGSSIANDPNRRYGGTGAMEGYPSAFDLGPLVPVAGARVPLHDKKGAALVLGLEVTRPGLFWFERVEMDFRVGSREYTIRNEQALMFCAPRAVFDDTLCPDFEEHPSEACRALGYIPLGANGCVPRSPGSG